jgi:hypothetical protein
MPEVERLEELTRALGKYLEQKKTRADRSPSSSSSESSDKENKAPESVIPIKKEARKKKCLNKLRLPQPKQLKLLQ